MADLDFYAVAIRQIQEDLIKKLEEVIPRLKKLSDTEMINVAQQIDFMTELDELGYGRLLDRMNKAYEDEILRAYRELSRARVAISSSSAVLIDQLRSFDMEYLSSGVQEYANDLKVALMRGIITGEATAVIVENLRSNFGPGKRIGSARSVAIVNDTFARFSNANRLKAFESLGDDVKYIYIGPGKEDPNTRDSCVKVLEYVEKNGPLTASEIRDLRNVIGQQKDGSRFFGFSDRGGYNCRHDWIRDV